MAASEGRYRVFLEGAPDAFYMHDEAGRFVDFNRRACESLGYTREELLQLSVTDVDQCYTLETARSVWQEVHRKGSQLIHGRHRRKDGSSFPVEVHIGTAILDGRHVFLAMARDVSERETAERRLIELGNLYRALSEINQAIVRVTDENELMAKVCRVAVDYGGLRMAWIGRANPATGQIEPVTSYGVGTEYLQGLVICADSDCRHGAGPTARAFRELQHWVVNDFMHSELTRPWHDQGAHYGWQASAAFPLPRGGKPYAVLTVYHDRKAAFTDEIVQLLDELAQDISFALDTLDRDRQRSEALAQIEERNTFLSAILDNEPECVKVVAPNGDLLQMNQAGLSMLEVDNIDNVRQNGLISFVAPEHQQAFSDFLHHIGAGNSGSMEFRVIGRKGTERWLETHARPLRNTAGDITGVLSVTRDITQKKHFDEMLWRQANLDPLTGLPNRHRFIDLLNQQIARSLPAAPGLAVIFIDLDRFKEINDTLGHEIGDALLIEASDRIARCLDPADIHARVGGDEFGILLRLSDHDGRVDRTAAAIVAALAQPFELGETRILGHVSASAGITLYPADGNTAVQLMRNVDQALYLAKSRGRNRFSRFTPELQEHAQYRHRLLLDLRQAIASDQLVLYFQPIVDFETYRTVKIEALIRWHHPTRGMISPAEFIPLAEEHGLIVDLGRWVFREACRWLMRWSGLGMEGFKVGVNMSAVQLLGGPQCLDTYFDCLRQSGLDGKRFDIEITESLLLNANGEVRAVLDRLHESGITLSIDDFGTGYSALSYLKKFSIDHLKIDQSFVRDLTVDSSDLALCQAIIVMAHKLGLQVVAEGVETPEQRDLLKAAGCDYAQGFFFSRPAPGEAIEALLRTGGPLPA